MLHHCLGVDDGVNRNIMSTPGADPGFWEGGSEHRGGSLKQGVWGAQPPRSYRVSFI